MAHHYRIGGFLARDEMTGRSLVSWSMRIHPPDPSLPEPPFEQLRAQVARRAASGELPAGTKLPTVRALATELGLAANTVARAYRELEADGVVVTEGRRGTFIAYGAAATSADATEADIQAFLRERVAAYKVPKRVLFFEDGKIPMTGSHTKVRDDELLALVTARPDALQPTTGDR